MIREVLQRPGRLRMRLTVVAAASALFVLVVLAALVLPSLQHNLEQSRIASLRASVEAVSPDQLLQPFGQSQLSPSFLQSLAATLGVARITIFTENGLQLRRASDSSSAPLDRKTLALVEQSANLHRNASSVTNLHGGGRTAVLTFPVSSAGVDGVVLVQAPLSDVQEQVSAVERRLVFGGVLGRGALCAAVPAPSVRQLGTGDRAHRLRGGAAARRRPHRRSDQAGLPTGRRAPDATQPADPSRTRARADRKPHLRRLAPRRIRAF